MGALKPVTGLISTAINPVQTILGATRTAQNVAQIYANYDQTLANHKNAQAQYALKEQQRQQTYRNTQAKLALEAEKTALERRNALKRSVAKQQAEFGGQGLSAADGSGEAVLLGFFQQSDSDRQYQERLNRLKRQALSDDNAIKARSNLLELQEAQNNVRYGLIKNTGSATKLFASDDD